MTCRCHGQPIDPIAVEHPLMLAKLGLYHPSGAGCCIHGYNAAHDSCPSCDMATE